MYNKQLQERKVRPVGGVKELDTDVRVIAACNANLPDYVAQGRFRKDLYYRLSTFPVHIPPLRERPGDIPALADAILDDLSRKLHRSFSLTGDAVSRLQAHDWPGNVRELKNFIERLVITSSDFSGEIHTIPPEMFGADANLSRLDRKPKASSLSLSQSEEKELNDIVSALYRSGGNRSLAAEQLGVSRRTLQYKLKKYRIKVNMEPQVYIGETPAAKE